MSSGVLFPLPEHRLNSDSQAEYDNIYHWPSIHEGQRRPIRFDTTVTDLAIASLRFVQCIDEGTYGRITTNVIPDLAIIRTRLANLSEIDTQRLLSIKERLGTVADIERELLRTQGYFAEARQGKGRYRQDPSLHPKTESGIQSLHVALMSIGFMNQVNVGELHHDRLISLGRQAELEAAGRRHRS